MRTRGNLKSLAWLEYRITKQCAGESPEQYLANWLIPGWFVFYELGFGFGEGPSLQWTLENLPETNRKNTALLRARSTPPKVKLTPRQRQSKLRRLAHRAGISVAQLRNVA